MTELRSRAFAEPAPSYHACTFGVSTLATAAMCLLGNGFLDGRTHGDDSVMAVLRKLSTTVGVVKATDVDDVSAVCEPVSGAGFKIGDTVKTVAQ